MELRVRVSTLVLFVLAVVSPLFAEQMNEPSWVYKGRGDRYFHAGETGKAIAEYKKALAKKKEETRDGRSGAYPEVHIQLAKIYLQDGLYELAFAYAESAERDRDALQIEDLLFEIKYTKAEILEKQRKSPDKILEDIVGEDENWRNRRGRAFGETLLRGKFIKDERSRARYARAHFELGRLKYITGNYENAVPFLEMALLYRYRPDEAIRYLVDSYRRLGNLPMAQSVPKLYREMGEAK